MCLDRVRCQTPIRVCVCTSYSAEAEPRAPRHAAVLADSGLPLEVIFVDCAPMGISRHPPKILKGLRNFHWQTHYYPHRAMRPLSLCANRIRQKLYRMLFSAFGFIHPAAISHTIVGLQKVLENLAADVYLGHNIDTLFPICQVANRLGRLAMFDSMEFHSDMGASQSDLEKRIIRAIEAKCYPQCAKVFASSPQVADALAREYGIERPLPLYNVPPIESTLRGSSADNFALYWRNSTIGLGERGLEDALHALCRLPVDITLHIQGKLPADQRGRTILSRISELGIEKRVTIHDPYNPEDAVKEASRHSIGLCLERNCSRNHELTASNKIFDYHMAGLATVASNLPGLRAVIERSGGGLLFQPGTVHDLVEKINRLYHDRVLLRRLANNARAFALEQGNLEIEMQKFMRAFSDLQPSPSNLATKEKDRTGSLRL